MMRVGEGDACNGKKRSSCATRDQKRSAVLENCVRRNP
jgi:hypothetical protein